MGPKLLEIFRRIAGQMRETCARVVELMKDQPIEDIVAQIRALPLPGDKE